MTFRPLLAPQENPKSCPDFYSYLTDFVIASPKIDGIRGVVKRSKMMSRTFKPHANLQVQSDFTGIDHIDGELTFGEPTGVDVMNRAQSNVRSVRATGDFRFYVFDWTAPDMLNAPFYERLEVLQEKIQGNPLYRYVEQVELDSLEAIFAYEEKCLAAGYEGIMVRNPVGPYKQGRATMLDRIVWKLKRFEDEEFACVGIEEAMHNANAATTNALGYTERSTHKQNMVPSGLAGKYLCYSPEGFVFKVQPGAFTHSERRAHFLNPSIVTTKKLTVRFFGRTPDGAYRFARVVAIRFDI